MVLHHFVWVDAFTDHRCGGNPYAVVFDADDADDAVRIAVTRETRLSECAFLEASDIADVGVAPTSPRVRSPWRVIRPSRRPSRCSMPVT